MSDTELKALQKQLAAGFEAINPSVDTHGPPIVRLRALRFQLLRAVLNEVIDEL